MHVMSLVRRTLRILYLYQIKELAFEHSPLQTYREEKRVLTCSIVCTFSSIRSHLFYQVIVFSLGMRHF